MKTILNYLGHILIIFSLFSLLPFFYGLFMGEKTFIFLIMTFVSFSIGFFLKKISKEINYFSQKTFSFNSISLTEGFIIAALSFIFCSLISMLPYLTIFRYNSNSFFIDALFESVSGITTTGLTIIPDLSLIPSSVILWRSLTQWIGGIGIVIVFLFIIYKIRASSNITSNDSGSSVRLFKSIFAHSTEPNVTKLLYSVLTIYISITFIGILAYYLAGLSIFEATNITFTAISTGGFTPTNSFDYNNYILGITIFLMIFGAISFITHERLLKRKFRDFLKDLELKYFISLLIIFITIAFLLTQELRTNLFQITSALTGTGFSISNISILHPFTILVIFLAMFIGGSTCSTSGGIKQYRFIILIKSIIWQLKKLSSPATAVIPFKIDDKNTLDEESLSFVAIMVVSFIFLTLIGVILFTMHGFSLYDSFFQVISALCTVGLSTLDISLLPSLLKFVLILLMLLGRLEIFPILILLKKAIKR
jgi:trk system potassium uptake protein